VERCELFRKYERKWRKLPPVPVLDVWNLKLAGYCPFISSSSKAFWYKSVVVLTADALWFAVNNIIRHGIRNVVIVFDEYLFHLMRKVGVGRVDVGKLEKVFGGFLDREFDVRILKRGEGGEWVWVVRRLRVRDAVSVWNNALGLVERAGVEKYTRMVEGRKGAKLAGMLVEGVLKSVVDIKDDIVNNYTVYDLVVYMFDAALAVLYASRFLPDIDGRMRLRRLGLRMLSGSLSLISAVGVIDVVRNAVAVVDRVVGVRWVFEGGEEYVVGYAGGFVRSVISLLLMRGRSVGVVTTSVDDSDVLVWRMYPHESLKHVRIDVSKIRKRVKAVKMLWSPKMFYVGEGDYGGGYVVRRMVERSVYDLHGVIRDVLNIEGNVVVVCNKRVIVYVSDVLRRSGYKVEVHGDERRGVVDYVLVKKGDGNVLMLVSPHSRVAVGVDPPVLDPRVLVVLYGMRRRAREYVKMYAGSLDGLVSEFADVRIYREGDVYYVYGGRDVKYDYLLVYDAFDAKFDKHMLVQVIGRWYMRNVGFVVYNGKYDLFDIKYYAVDDGVFEMPDGEFYVERGTVGFGLLTKVVVEPAKSFDEAVSKVVSLGCDNAVDAEKVVRGDYFRLRSVYNSLRFIRVQLRYRRLGDRDLWLLARKLAVMVNAFTYADKNGLDVLDGLKRFYRVFKGGGVDEMLEAVKSSLGIGDDDWGRVVRRLAVCGVRSLFLEYKYKLRKVPKGVVIVGVNDWRNRADLTKYLSTRKDV